MLVFRVLNEFFSTRNECLGWTLFVLGNFSIIGIFVITTTLIGYLCCPYVFTCKKSIPGFWNCYFPIGILTEIIIVFLLFVGWVLIMCCFGYCEWIYKECSRSYTRAIQQQQQ